MRIRKKENASVTVALCLTIVVTAALIFSLAEAARYYGVKEDAAEWSHLAAESLAAGYQPYLSKKYDLFLLDGSFLGEEFDTDALEAEMDALLAYNVLSVTEKEGINLYHMQKAESEITDYVLLTDDDGRVFMSQTAKIMKKNDRPKGSREDLRKSQYDTEQTDDRRRSRNIYEHSKADFRRFKERAGNKCTGRKEKEQSFKKR